jgi:peroxidase
MRHDQCLKNITGGRKNLAPLDLQTLTAFDNNYYKNLIVEKGLLHSDQQLYNGGSTDSLVKTYSNNVETFNKDFVTAKIKMGDIEPLARLGRTIGRPTNSGYIMKSRKKKKKKNK